MIGHFVNFSFLADLRHPQRDSDSVFLAARGMWFLQRLVGKRVVKNQVGSSYSPYHAHPHHGYTSSFVAIENFASLLTSVGPAGPSTVPLTQAPLITASPQFHTSPNLGSPMPPSTTLGIQQQLKAIPASPASYQLQPHMRHPQSIPQQFSPSLLDELSVQYSCGYNFPSDGNDEDPVPPNLSAVVIVVSNSSPVTQGNMSGALQAEYGGVDFVTNETGLSIEVEEGNSLTNTACPINNSSFLLHPPDLY